MKKYFPLILIALICCLFYFIGPRQAIESGTVRQSNEQRPGEIKRVISLCKHPIPIVLLGLDASEKRLVGVNPDAKLSMQSIVLNKYFPGFQNLSGNVCTKAFVPNIEEIIKLKPDLILQWNRFPESIAMMQHFGFHVVGVDYDGTDDNDREMVRLMAKALGREKKADSILLWRDTTQRQIKSVSERIAPAKKPKVIFFYDYETLRVGGEKCYENFCINLVGGRNMGAGLGVDRSVNIEQILAWDPDIIIFGGWRNRVTPDDIYQNPILANLSAVRNRRVFKMPVWASNESVLIWKWMAQMIQPDLFDYKLREEIKASYLWQYKIALTEEDLDQVLFYKENTGSGLYATLKRKI